MSYPQTINQLAELKLNGMLQACQNMEIDPHWFDQSFDEKLAYMVNQEYERRLNARVRNRLKDAGFKDMARIHDLLYTPERNLSKNLIDRFASHRWIQNHENIIITGPTGTGKSFLAQALGDHACRYGFRVRYYRLPDLINDLLFGKKTGRYSLIRKALRHRDVLILDDWGMATLDTLAGHELAEIIEDRLGQRSTIVVSQFPIGAWDKIFQDKTTADAVMDRLVHVAYTIELKGPSLRTAAASQELKEYKRAMVE